MSFHLAGLIVLLISLIPKPVSAFDLTFHSPFDACERTCTASLFAGVLVKTPMYYIFVTKHEMPWDWEWRHSQFVGATLAREVVTIDRYAAIETEIGAGKRFGFLNEGEVWGALYFRWKAFPWNEYVRTSVALSTGLNYATDVPEFEKLRTRGEGSQLLHYLSPELTLGLPSQPNIDFFVRFHHRSGGKFAIFNHTSGGAQYGTAGIRYRF